MGTVESQAVTFGEKSKGIQHMQNNKNTMAVIKRQQMVVNHWKDCRESPALVKGRYVAPGFAQLNIILGCSMVHQVLL